MRGVTAGSESRERRRRARTSSRRDSASAREKYRANEIYRSTMNLRSCARLKPAWLTIGAMTLRRIR